MPELPEVETVLRELKPDLLNKKISGMDILWPKTFVGLSEVLLEGQTINGITRKGKYLTIVLSASYLVIHLRMTGQLQVHYHEPLEQDSYLRWCLNFTDTTQLWFSDKRKFGRVYHLDQADNITDKIGIDALSDDLDEKRFIKLLGTSRMRIKTFLLSQRYISGLGNIYTDEVLFRSGIHPTSVCAQIPRKVLKILFYEMRQILQFAIDNMGSTISDYRDPKGNPGNFQHFFNVYQQQGKPCVKCKTIVHKIKLGGRGTHFCPSCQKVYV